MNEYQQAVRNIIEYIKENPIDLINIGDQEGEYQYLLANEDAYSRTVADVCKLFPGNRKKIKILEIGSFLGPVSLALKILGFDMYAYDIPEFQKNVRLKKLYKHYGVPFAGGNLRHYKLPYNDRFFDAVLICETMEHLNFNPVPVVYEINRVTKNGGFIYIEMPNQTRLANRVKMLFGKSVHHTISAFHRQLSKDGNMIVGIHWREYTKNETKELIGSVGYAQVKSFHYFSPESRKGFTLKKLIKFFIGLVPGFRSFYVVVGKKEKRPKFNFWFTEANR